MEEKEKIHVAIVNHSGQPLYEFDMNIFSVSSETIERAEELAKEGKENEEE